MSADDCAGFVREIQEHFAYLLTDHGFEVADTRVAQKSEQCLVLLKSNRCLLRFILSLGRVEISVAVVSAPVGWEDKSGGVRYWFDLLGIFNYLANRTRSEEENRQLGERLWKMSSDAYLEYMARELFPVRNQMLDAFDEKAFAVRRAEIEAFLGA